jgi:translation initiation factor 2 subunit 1
MAVPGSETTPICINLIAPPLYVITTTTLEKDIGVKLLNDALETIRTVIVAKGGKMDIKMAPKAVSDKEERFEFENKEVDGDNEPDEE